jgi:rare lipoprotein A
LVATNHPACCRSAADENADRSNNRKGYSNRLTQTTDRRGKDRKSRKAAGPIEDHSVSRAAPNPTKEDRHFTGLASYYQEPQDVASDDKFDPLALTCAHRTLPFGTHLLISDPQTGRSVVVTVNDRGPFVRGRVLDLSLGAARALGMTDRGVIRVSASVR